jgi:hypothetical protein
VITLSIIRGYIVFVGFPGEFFPRITASEEVAIEALNEMDFMQFYEFPWWNLLENKQNFWTIFVPSSLLIVLITLVIQQLLQRRRHRENETKKMPTQVQKMLQEHEIFIRQFRATMALIQKTQDGHCARLQNEIESVKKVMKEKERHLAQFQNVLDIMETMSSGEEHLALLEKQLDLIEKVKEAEIKRFAQIQKEKHSVKMEVETSLSVPTGEMVGDPASMESLDKMTTPRKSDTAASNYVADKKKKVSVSKIPVRLVPLPYAKPFGDDVCHKPGGSHVKMIVQKLESNKTQAVRAELYREYQRRR